MAEKKDKPDENTASETPSVPEVEAEIVEDDAPPDIGALFEHDQPEDGPTPEEASSQKPKPALTPGAMVFIALAAVVLAALLFWRFQGDDEALSPSAVSTPQNEAPDDAPLAPPVEPDVPPEVGTSPAGIPEVTTDPGKIRNDALSAIEPPVPSPDSLQTNDTFLPALPSESDQAPDRTFGEQLKDTLKQEAGPAATPEEGDPADAPFSFSVEDGEQSRDDETGADDATADENRADDLAASDAPRETVIEEASLPVSAEEALSADTKIANDMDAIKDIVRAETAAFRAALDQERDRRAALETEIETMRREFEAALAARDQRAAAALSAMRADLKKIENTGGVSPAKLAAGAIAFSALKRAMETGAPFEAELDALAGIEPGAPLLRVLQPQAKTGVPTLEALKATFGEAARKGLAVAGQEEAGGPLAALGARAKNLVSVRPATPQTGDSAAAIISRAESAVQNNEISAALNELSGLSATVREAMGDWLEKAEDRASAEAAADAIGEQFLAAANQAKK